LQDRLTSHLQQILVDHYLELDASGNFKNPPATDDELHEFILAAYGVSIPRKTITPGHRSPFEFMADLFFERVKNAIGFANRNGGKTLNVAILNHLDMLFKPGCEICSAGAVKDQAIKCYRYFRGFLKLPWFTRLNDRYKEIIGRPFCYPERDSLQSLTEFANGARLEVITGSEKGLQGPHPHKSRIDEVDSMEWQTLTFGLSMARSEEGIRGQNVFTSTRRYMDGAMQKLLDTAKEKGIEVYSWDVWESIQRCSRRCKNDPEHGDCPIFTYCKGRSHSCAGFYLTDDFIDKVRLLDRRAFETEWENKRPLQHRLVYHMLDDRHLMTPDKLRQMTGMTSPSSTWQRVCGLDFGSSPGHPFVYLKFFEIPNAHCWLLYHEYVAEQRLIRDHALAIKSSPWYYPGERIFADHDAQDRMELEVHGVKTLPAIKGAGSVNMGVDLICSMLSGRPPQELPELYIWHDCVHTLREWGSLYAWPVRPDGRVDRSGNPCKEHDHTSDAARMALFSSRRGGKPSYGTYRV